jgi:xanthine dehydrogenase iron-sulfur cluster and FAD-binding subunit A
MYNFNYHQAKSVDEAAKLVSGAEEGKLMAGGMTLIPTLKQRLAKPSDVVDLGKIGDLKGIKKDGNNIVIGAMTRHFDVASSDVVKSAIPGLAGLASHIGDPAVRTRRRIIPRLSSRSMRRSSPTSAKSRLTISSRVSSRPRSSPASSSPPSVSRFRTSRIT